jgi:TRAP-type C4-dicarboxylate transport system permease large subunit
VNVDTELETWQQEWRTQTDPLPDLKKKIRRQNSRMIAAVALTGLCLILSTVAALKFRTLFLFGLASGIGFSSILLGGYAWWVRRGAWKPAAQTTLAYLDLAHKRAIARARSLRFGFYFLLIATLLFAGFASWNWRHTSARAVAILAAMVIELFYFNHIQRRQKLELEKARLLKDRASEPNEFIS